MEDEKVVTPKPEEGEDKTKENESESDDKDLKSALAQKEHFREKSEKLEKEAEELRTQVETAQKEEPKPQVPKDANPDISALQDKLARIEFAQKHPEIDAGDIEQIFDLANMNKKSPDEVLEKNDMVKTYLEKKADENKVANATPDNIRSGGVAPEKPITEMSRDEHREFAEKVMGQR